MASTFSQIKSGLDALADRLSANRAKALTSKQSNTDIAADITQMGTDNAQLFTDINALATANPNDVAIQNAKAEKDQLVAEGTALKNAATAAANAMNV